jgi:hypothetical protein
LSQSLAYNLYIGILNEFKDKWQILYLGVGQLVQCGWNTSIHLIQLFVFTSKYNCSIWRVDVGMSSGVLNSRPEVNQMAT